MQEIADGATTEDEIPQALRNRPILNQYQVEYMRMYNEISGSRTFTPSGVAEIPYPTKIVWLNENWIDDPDDRRDYLYMVGVLDGFYLNHYYEKNRVK